MNVKHVIKNFFLSDLSKALRNGFFHSTSSSIARAILNGVLFFPSIYESTITTTAAVIQMRRS
jgi:hypothetical protein